MWNHQHHLEPPASLGSSLFNKILESGRMPNAWRSSTIVPIYKKKGDIQQFGNYWGIKLMSHTMKLWERVIDARLRATSEVAPNQFGFVPGCSTTDAIFALRILMEKHREKQQPLHTLPSSTWRRPMTVYQEI
jgi:hypothetical protein